MVMPASVDHNVLIVWPGFTLVFNPDGLHLELIGWTTVPGDMTALCSP